MELCQCHFAEHSSEKLVLVSFIDVSNDFTSPVCCFLLCLFAYSTSSICVSCILSIVTQTDLYIRK